MRWLIFLTGLYGTAAPAQDAGPEIPLYVMNVPPYSLIGGQRHGIVGDIALEALRRSGVRFRIVEAPNARALHDVPRLGNALIVPLARLNERESDFTWIAHILIVRRAFFTLDRKVSSFAEARSQFKLIGVERGSAAHTILISHGFPEDRLIDVALDAMAPKMLHAGRIDAWFGVLQAGTPQDPDLVASAVPGASTEQYLACSKTCDPDLVRRLADAIRGMESDGTIGRIEGEYR